MNDDVATIAWIRSLLRAHPDFPIPGILFQDIFPVFQHPEAVRALIDVLTRQCQAATSDKIDVVVGLDARGFLFGPMLAQSLGAAFVPVRKMGKLPGACIVEEYVKEYGVDRVQMQCEGIQKGQRVVIVDDLIATGGTAKAAEALVEALGGIVVTHLFVVELAALRGRDKLSAPVYSMIKFDD